MLRCNGCWNECSLTARSVATACQHLFCVQCAQQIIEGSDQCCPICSTVITKNNATAVTVLQDSNAFKMVLAGQSPEVAMSAAMAAIQFYNHQQELNLQVTQQTMQERIEQTKEQCRAKLIPLRDAFESAKRKFQQVSQQKKALGEANHELTEKYNQKAMWVQA